MSCAKLTKEQEAELKVVIDELFDEMEKEKEKDNKVITLYYKFDKSVQTDSTPDQFQQVIDGINELTLQQSINQQILFLNAGNYFKLCEILSDQNQSLTRMKMDQLRTLLNKQQREAIFKENRKDYLPTPDVLAVNDEDVPQIEKLSSDVQKMQSQSEIKPIVDQVDNKIQSGQKVKLKKKRSRSRQPYC